MATKTKRELIQRIAQESAHSRDEVKEIVQRLLVLMIRELSAGNRIEFRDFGVFETIERAPRIAVNPRTNESIEVPRRKTVKFKISKLMKKMLDGKDNVESFAFDMFDGDDGEFDG